MLRDIRKTTNFPEYCKTAPNHRSLTLRGDRLLTYLSSKSVLVLLCFNLKHRAMKRKRKVGLQKEEDAFRCLGDLTCKEPHISSGLNSSLNGRPLDSAPESKKSKRTSSSKKQVKGKNKENRCEQCNKTFFNATSLRRHMAIHTGEKRFVCPFCDERFLHHQTWMDHKKKHTGEMPSYQCGQCGKKFKKIFTLRMHMNTHTGAKPYVCSYCDEAFGCLQTRNKHVASHIMDKLPYQCPLCDMGFRHRRRSPVCQFVYLSSILTR